MRNNHAFVHRTHARAWWCAVALGCLPLIADAASVNRNNIGRAGITQTGRTTTLTPGAPPVNSGGSTIPVSPTYGGWSQAGNYGVPVGATGPTAGLNVNGTFIQGQRGNWNLGGAGGVEGVKYPASAGYQIPWSDVVLPALGFAATVVCTAATGGAATIACLGIPAALPYLNDWINRAGGRVNPQTGSLERQTPDSCPVGPCYYYRVESDSPPAGIFGYQSVTACQNWVEWRNTLATPSKVVYVSDTNTTCNVLIKATPTSAGSPYAASINRYSSPVRPATWLPSSMDDIAPYMQKVNPDPRVWGELIDKGAELPLPNPTVTGPSQIQGPETVKQNQDGTKEVSRTTYNFTTNNNQVTNTSNVTTTTTYNSSNVQTGTQTTTTTPSDSTPGAEPEDKPGECEKHPEILGCQKVDFDTPKEEMPKDTKTVTFQEQSLFGGGSCPADRMFTLHTGQTVKAWDWAQACNLMLPIRAIVMTLATFAAFLIVMPGMGGKSS